MAVTNMNIEMEIIASVTEQGRKTRIDYMSFEIKCTVILKFMCIYVK